MCRHTYKDTDKDAYKDTYKDTYKETDVSIQYKENACVGIYI